MLERPPGIMLEAVLQSTRLILVRHAQHDLSVDDGPLTAVGDEQARALARAAPLAGEDLLLSSSLRRSIATARAFRPSFAILPELDEFRFGDGAPDSGALVEQREDLALWLPAHGFRGGETLGDFGERVARAMERLGAEHAGLTVVAVTHAGVVDATLRWALGASAEAPWTGEATVPHASITELEHWPRGRHARGAPRFSLVRRIGDVSHLPPALVTGV